MSPDGKQTYEIKVYGVPGIDSSTVGPYLDRYRVKEKKSLRYASELGAAVSRFQAGGAVPREAITSSLLYSVNHTMDP